MDLLIPDSGLLFWMPLVFIIVFIILWKAGFPAIIKMVNERKAFIDDSLKKAHEANEKLAISKKKVNPSCRKLARSRLSSSRRLPKPAMPL